MRQFQWCVVFCVGVCLICGIVPNARAADFVLSSLQLKNGGKMPDEHVLNGFGCSGANISPELSWKNPPAGTKSFAVTAYDPDAPTGSGWWHWVIFNIHADVRNLPSGAGNEKGTPSVKGYTQSIQSMTDFGKPGYGGACPPKGHGLHHYIFTVYALGVASLPLDASAPAAMVGFYLNQHVIEKAQLTVTYQR